MPRGLLPLLLDGLSTNPPPLLESYKRTSAGMGRIIQAGPNQELPPFYMLLPAVHMSHHRSSHHPCVYVLSTACDPFHRGCCAPCSVAAEDPIIIVERKIVPCVPEVMLKGVAALYAEADRVCLQYVCPRWSHVIWSFQVVSVG